MYPSFSISIVRCPILSAMEPIFKKKIKKSHDRVMFIYTGNLMFIFSMLQTSELRKNTEIALN
ncbi:hypothetical protein BLOT_016774 [Blomia tropicalis]|nr:hypothetical protein BLOT_016774 [Blomia tropicalis]